MPSTAAVHKFTCNICGASCRRSTEELDRETPGCASCGSNVRTRGLLQVLSVEIFGVNLALPDFPRVKSLRGLGTSDDDSYAARLAGKFDYRNTFFDREPRFDIAHAPEEEFGKYDFLISSEVFEHVPPPVEIAFQNAFQLLKPSGVLVLTVPYSVPPYTTIEHFPQLHEYGLTRLGSRTVLVNRTQKGEFQVFEDLVFHGGIGATLEMRELSEADLKALLVQAGFAQIEFYTEDCPEFGILRPEQWSLPVAARKAPFAFSLDATRDLMTDWIDLKGKSTPPRRPWSRFR